MISNGSNQHRKKVTDPKKEREAIEERSASSFSPWKSCDSKEGLSGVFSLELAE